MGTAEEGTLTIPRRAAALRVRTDEVWLDVRHTASGTYHAKHAGGGAGCPATGAAIKG